MKSQVVERMGIQRKVLWFAAAFCCVLACNGQNDFLSYVAEGPLAAFLDAQVQPPLRNSGWDLLVPQEGIKLHCVRPRGQFFEQVQFTDPQVAQKLDLTRPITVVTHGWTENTNLTQYQLLTSRYREHLPDINYCLLDWGPYAQFIYEISARRSVPLVASLLATFIRSLTNYNLDRLSLVGFSMGGQIIGLAGKALNGRIGSLYPLDPAGPLFTHPFDVGTSRRLTKNDGKYVQVLYTSRYAIGMGPIVGHQNFLPNQGLHPQVACRRLSDFLNVLDGIKCSHLYAVTLFSEAVVPTHTHVGSRCLKSFGPFCVGTTVSDRVGIYSKRIAGDYYF